MLVRPIDNRPPNEYAPGAQVQRVDGGQLEVRLVDVQLADDVAEEDVLVRLGELEHGGQNRLLAAAAAARFVRVHSAAPAEASRTSVSRHERKTTLGSPS